MVIPPHRSIINSMTAPHDIHAIISKCPHLLRNSPDVPVQRHIHMLGKQLGMMGIQSGLNSRQGRICILTDGKMLVKDYALTEKFHGVWHQAIVSFLYCLPAESIHQNIQYHLFPLRAMPQLHRFSHDKNLWRLYRHRFRYLIVAVLVAPQHCIIGFLTSTYGQLLAVRIASNGQDILPATRIKV